MDQWVINSYTIFHFSVRTYMDPVKPGDLMPAACVAKVIFTKSSKFKEGDYVYGLMNW